MKQFFTVLIVCLIVSQTFAQQDPLYSQYLNNPFVLNPAYTGITNNLNLSVSYRKQWTGFDGSPATMNANGHISLMDNTMGAGLMVITDQIGSTSVNEIYGSYAYRLRLSEYNTLSFGMQIGVINFKTKNASLSIQHPDDPIYSQEISLSKSSIGSGMLMTGEKFLIGLSVPRMLKTKTQAGEFDPTLYNQHFYAMGSYTFFINERFRFRPSILAKLVSGSPASIDLNAAAILYQKYTIGILTRNFTTHGMFLQANIKDTFYLGYAIEIPTSKSVGSSFSTNEVTLGLRFNALSFHQNGISNF
jgi:type IX secretion system PorP/SprF family membrane protein